MPARRGVALALIGAVLTGAAITAPVASAGSGASTAHRSLPDQISLGASVRQLLTVTSRRWRTTRGTLRAWSRDSRGTWTLIAGPFPARIGWNGWVAAPRRVQSTGTSPAGKFSLPQAFGALTDPGTALPYRVFDRTDYWPYEPRDPATYNIYQPHKANSSHWRADYAERLWDYRDQYAYAAVIGFNLPSGVHYSAKRKQWVATAPADTARGGGIFLHVRSKTATAGCVAIDRPALRRVLRWLQPTRSPRIVMGPRSYVVAL